MSRPEAARRPALPAETGRAGAARAPSLSGRADAPLARRNSRYRERDHDARRRPAASAGPAASRRPGRLRHPGRLRRLRRLRRLPRTGDLSRPGHLGRADVQVSHSSRPREQSGQAGEPVHRDRQRRRGRRAGDTFPAPTRRSACSSGAPIPRHARTAAATTTTDQSTLGLSLTHLSGPGCAAYGDVPFLPTTGPIGSSPQGATESFSHASEQASPGYYQAQLGTPAINSQISVNSRAGLGVFTYPATTQANMLIKAGDSANGNDAASVQVVGTDEVTGSSTSGHFCGSPGHYTVYFAAKFNRSFSSDGTWTPSGVSAGTNQARTNGRTGRPSSPPPPHPLWAPSVRRPGHQTGRRPQDDDPAGQHVRPGPGRAQGPAVPPPAAEYHGPATGAWVTFDPPRARSSGCRFRSATSVWPTPRPT